MTTAPSPADAPAFYDEMWRRYAHLDRVSPAAFHRRRMITKLARRYAPGARRALDVGCGQGELLRELERALPGATVDGADLSEQSLRDTRAENPAAELFVVDLSAAALETTLAARLGAYDLVVCSEVVEHIDDDAGAVGRLAQLLAPGGTLIVTVPGGRMSRFDEAIGHFRHYRPRALARLLGASGLEVVRVLAWGFPFHSFYRSAVRAASRWSMPRAGEAASTPEDGRGGVLTSALGAAYGVFGRALKPLFYLNASRFGEQLLAVARRPREP